jgi:hypothetical protein
MQTTTLLQVQYNGIHQILHMVADDLTQTEWTTCVFPGTNRPSFTCWHVVRTWDWAIQTGIRGVPEVIADERWTDWNELTRTGIGAGLSLEQANEIPQLVSPGKVLAYADAVHSTIKLSDDDRETIPDMKAHMAPYPTYQLPDFREETDDLIGLPT